MGLAAADACVNAGARVVVVGRDPKNAEAAGSKLGEAAAVVTGDAAHPRTAEHAIETAMSRFGGFHGLYHVAGGSGRKAGDGPLHEVSDEGWRYTLDLNLTSLFYSNRAAVRHFLAQDTRGSVLNMGSVLGFAPSPRFFATHAYAATKS